jgi:hypothetical protein
LGSLEVPEHAMADVSAAAYLVITAVMVEVKKLVTKMYGPPRDCKGKTWARRQVCANVFVNKGEGVVKDKDILFAA